MRVVVGIILIAGCLILQGCAGRDEAINAANILQQTNSLENQQKMRTYLENQNALLASSVVLNYQLLDHLEIESGKAQPSTCNTAKQKNKLEINEYYIKALTDIQTKFFDGLSKAKIQFDDQTKVLTDKLTELDRELVRGNSSSARSAYYATFVEYTEIYRNFEENFTKKSHALYKRSTTQLQADFKKAILDVSELSRESCTALKTAQLSLAEQTKTLSKMKQNLPVTIGDSGPVFNGQIEENNTELIINLMHHNEQAAGAIRNYLDAYSMRENSLISEVIPNLTQGAFSGLLTGDDSQIPELKNAIKTAATEVKEQALTGGKSIVNSFKSQAEQQVSQFKGAVGSYIDGITGTN